MVRSTAGLLLIFASGARRIFSLPFRTSPRLASCDTQFSAIPISRTWTTRVMSVPGSFSCNESTAGLKDIGAASRTTEEAGTGNDTYRALLTPWRETITLSMAKSREIRGGNYVQISTVDPETNEPRCRTVVFRGFQKMSVGDDVEKSRVMKMITDTRSNIVKELTTSSSFIAEVVWWFSKSSEQYRISGRIQFIGEPHGPATSEEMKFLYRARREQWGNLSDSAREQFYWKQPGAPYSEQNEVPTGGRDAVGEVLPPPKEFLLMLLHPLRVDYLRLTDNYRQIDELDADNNSWKTKRVNP